VLLLLLLLLLHRYQVVTIKHSGSLVTLSADGFAAKNSLNNAFTAAGALLLLTHYQRLCGDAAEAEQKVQRLMAALREQHLVVSFEMVTGGASEPFHCRCTPISTFHQRPLSQHVCVLQH
jgi:hypothetical protein